MIFMLVYVMFSFWIQICRKLYFTNLANPKNPNLNLDSTDYGCEIRLELTVYTNLSALVATATVRIKYSKKKALMVEKTTDSM